MGGGLEDRIAGLVLQQLVEEGEEQARLVAKCVAVLEQLGGLEGDQELATARLRLSQFCISPTDLEGV